MLNLETVFSSKFFVSPKRKDFTAVGHFKGDKITLNKIDPFWTL